MADELTAKEIRTLAPEQAQGLLKSWKLGHEQEISVAQMRLRVLRAMKKKNQAQIEQEIEDAITDNFRAIDEIEKMLGELPPKLN